MSNVQISLTPGQVEKFWRQVERGAEDECWEWQGARARNGYGRFSLGGSGGRWAQTHRVAYTLVNGPVPDGWQVHHRCRNRACVNPAHLEAVTTKAHRRAHLKTHCKHGHEFTAENTYTNKHGHRCCRACQRRWQVEHHGKRITDTTRTCPVCETEFVPQRGLHRYCKVECRDAAQSERRRLARLRAKRDHAP